MREHRAGLTRNQVRQMERAQAQNVYIQQIIGNCAGLAVASNMNEEEIRHELAETVQATLSGQLRFAADPFWASLKRARQRPNFLS